MMLFSLLVALPTLFLSATTAESECSSVQCPPKTGCLRSETGIFCIGASSRAQVTCDQVTCTPPRLCRHQNNGDGVICEIPQTFLKVSCRYVTCPPCTECRETPRSAICVPQRPEPVSCRQVNCPKGTTCATGSDGSLLCETIGRVVVPGPVTCQVVKCPEGSQCQPAALWPFCVKDSKILRKSNCGDVQCPVGSMCRETLYSIGPNCVELPGEHSPFPPITCNHVKCTRGVCQDKNTGPVCVVPAQVRASCNFGVKCPGNLTCHRLATGMYCMSIENIVVRGPISCHHVQCPEGTQCAEAALWPFCSNSTHYVRRSDCRDVVCPKGSICSEFDSLGPQCVQQSSAAASSRIMCDMIQCSPRSKCKETDVGPVCTHSRQLPVTCSEITCRADLTCDNRNGRGARCVAFLSIPVTCRQVKCDPGQHCQTRAGRHVCSGRSVTIGISCRHVRCPNGLTCQRHGRYGPVCAPPHE